MKITSALVTAISGSVGGLTGSRNRGGNYFRSRAVPVDPATASQIAVRGNLANLAALWSTTLTAAQRDAWTLYANNVPVIDTLGNQLVLTGQQMYLRSNTARLRAGLARVDDGPTLYSLPDFDSPTFTATAGSPGTVDVTYDDTQPVFQEDGGAMLVQLSRQLSPGVNFFKGPFRLPLPSGAVLGDSVTPPTSPATVTSPFGYTSGNAAFARVSVTRADGRLSNGRVFRFPIP